MRNIELKARLSSLAAAREIARKLATRFLGMEHQVDTYFHAPRGRLKLREIVGREAQLVAYLRPDQAGPKGSDYTLAPVADPAALKQALTTTLGVRIVVDKRREIFLHDNVRIHLDDVSGLGEFLEFEAVLGEGIDDETGQRQIAWLSEQFAIADSALVAASYADLLLEVTEAP